MRKKVRRITALICAIATVVSGIVYNPGEIRADGTEVIGNTTFENGDGWNPYGFDSYQFNGNGEFSGNVPAKTGGDNWTTQLVYSNMELQAGKYYEASVTIESTITRKFTVLVQSDGSAGGNWSVINGDTTFTVEANTPYTYTNVFQVSTANNPYLFGVMMGSIDSESYSACTVNVSNVSLKMYDSNPNGSDGFTSVPDNTQTRVGNYSLYAGSWAGAAASYQGAGETYDDMQIRIDSQAGGSGDAIWGLQFGIYWDGLETGEEYTYTVNYTSTQAGTIWAQVPGASYVVSLDEITVNSGENTFSGEFTAGVDPANGNIMLFPRNGLPAGTIITFTSVNIAKKSSSTETSTESGETSSAERTWIKIDNGSSTILTDDYYYNSDHSVTSVVNVQQPDGWGEIEIGIYITLPDGVSTLKVNDTAITENTNGVGAIQGASILVYLSALNEGENEIEITNGSNVSKVIIKKVVQETTSEQQTETTTAAPTIDAPEGVSVEPDEEYKSFTVTFTGNEEASFYKLYVDDVFKCNIVSGQTISIDDYDASALHVFAVTANSESAESQKKEYTVKIKSGSEVLKNTEFTDASNWYEGSLNGATFDNKGDDDKDGYGSVEMAIPAYSSGENWHTQIKQENLKLFEGYWYVAEMNILSDVDKTVELLIQHDGTTDKAWTVYSHEYVELQAGIPTKVQIQFQATESTGASVLYGLMLGYVNGISCETANVTISNVSFKVYDDEQIIAGTQQSILTSSDVSVLGFQMKTNWTETTDLIGFRSVCKAPSIGSKIKVGNTVYTVARIGTIETPEADSNVDDIVYDKTCTYIESYTMTDDQSADDTAAGRVAPFQIVHTATSEGIIGTDDGYSTYILTLRGAPGVMYPANSIHVRAFVVTTGGTIIYSKDAVKTSIVRVADYMYANSKISNVVGHEYLYNNILSVEKFVPTANTDYFATKTNPYYRTEEQKVDYGWNNNLYTNQDAERYTNLKPDEYLSYDYLSSKSGVADSELNSSLETSNEEVIAKGSSWKYTMSETNVINVGWNKLNFNDSSWSESTAPFGDREGYNTSWTGDNNFIFLRKSFDISDVELYRNYEMEINTFYDDNPRIYLNGNLIFADTDLQPWSNGYEKITIPSEYSDYLREGKNIIAIQCSNDSGGRQIDMGLTLTKAKDIRGTINKTPDGDILKLGGLKFDYGISANASGYFEYEVPAGATNLVGIVGADESSEDGSAITYEITVDDLTLAKGTVDKGDIDCIDVDIKKDSTKVKIIFTGSGVATMANAGWMIDEELAKKWNSTLNDPDDITRIYVTIDGEAKSINKDNKTAATVMVLSADGSVNSISSTSGAIKLRGNSTALADKKAYNVYFDNSVEIFKGKAKGKKWSLLANAYDKSLLRSKLVFDLSKNIGMKVATPETKYVDLYINGQLMGSYLLSEPADNGRAGISYDEDNDKEILFELENNDKVESGVLYKTTNLGLRFATEDTDSETSAKYTNWVDTLSKFETVLSENSDDIFNYIDKDSFVDMYVINELFKTVDFGYSSVKFYTNYDSENDRVVIHAGCLWDFDLSAGNSQFADLIDPEAEGEGTLRGQAVNVWFKLLMQNTTFSNAVKERFSEIQPYVVNMYQDNSLGMNQIDANIEVMGLSKDRNYSPISEGGAGWSQTRADSAEYTIYAYGYNTIYPYSTYTYEQHVEFLRDWLMKRNNYLLTKWGLQ